MSVAWNLVPVSIAAWTAMEVTSATVSMVTRWRLMDHASVSNVSLKIRKKTRLSYLHMHMLNVLGFCVCVCVFEDSRTCSLAHCQYGCEEVQGEIRCLCPSAGLQLGQDGRTCVGEQPNLEALNLMFLTYFLTGLPCCIYNAWKNTIFLIHCMTCIWQTWH